MLTENPSGTVLGVLFGATVAGLIITLVFRRIRAAGMRVAARPTASTNEVSKLAQEQYQTLFQSSPVPTFICDTRKWRLLEVNEAAARDYGYSREELLKMTLLDIGLPEDAERMTETLMALGPASGE